MELEVFDNFAQHIFYHGTSVHGAQSIMRRGFQTWYTNKECGRLCRGGSLGTGIYLTCNWRMAFWFGRVLLRVEVVPGTRLLNAAVPPCDKTMAYLQREFGRDILKKPSWQVVPKNKKLKHDDLGIVVFADDRLAVKEVIGCLSDALPWYWVETDALQIRDLEEWKRQVHFHDVELERAFAARAAA